MTTIHAVTSGLSRRLPRRLVVRVLAALGTMLAVGMLLWPTSSAQAVSYPSISGDGSTWAGNAMNDWTTAVKAQGVTVDFNPDGSSLGRSNFAQDLSDFAVSEIPYTGDTADPQDTARPSFSYGLFPVVAGGTSFMYNLQVNGKRLTTLKLDQPTLAGIFSGQITQWNDARIKATNPGVALPAQRITVVVRSEGSGATAQFTLWMKRQFHSDYAALCKKTGCNANNATSYFPYQGLSNFVAQSGSNGVTTYVANTPYTIGYDEYSYALGVGFPVAQIKNAAGYYTIPTDTAVAVALTQAKINTDKKSLNYLSQDLSNVYEYKDPRTYPISAYSYMIVPTQLHGNFDKGKGSTLAYYSTFNLCEGQRTMGALGYSPLPMNLVLAAMDQVKRIPGIDSPTSQTIARTEQGVASGKANPCNNPTFRPGDDPAHNILIDSAPFPAGCNAACQAPWTGVAVATNHGPGGKPTKGHTTNGGGPSGTKSTGPGTPTNSTGPGTATGPGSTAPGTAPSGGPGATTGNAPGATNPSSAPSVACDADTGTCAAPNVTSDGTQVVADPSVIAGQSTWGNATAALCIAGALGIGVLMAPPLLTKYLRRGKP